MSTLFYIHYNKVTSFLYIKSHALPLKTMATYQFVLTSSSPSRRQVLRNAGIDPVIISPDFDEDALLAKLNKNPDLTPAEKVCALAQGKAQSVLHNPRDLQAIEATSKPTVVVACDSMLLLDGRLSGKPHTPQEAIRRWHQQKGRTAELVTGHAIMGIGFSEQRTLETTAAVSTKVHFGNPSDTDIEAYARSGEPLGCAGAFTLEAKGGWFIDGIDGDPSSVLGISLPLIQQTLSGWDLNISDFW